MTATPVWLLTPENVKNVEGDDFELLCFQLLEYAVQRRHVGDTLTATRSDCARQARSKPPTTLD